MHFRGVVRKTGVVVGIDTKMAFEIYTTSKPILGQTLPDKIN